MQTKNYSAQKMIMRNYMQQLEDCAPEQVLDVLNQFVSENYTWIGVFPFMDLHGAQAVADTFWIPLKQSLAHMQRRQDIFMAGTADDGKDWVMSMGHFMGLFDQNFLNIPRTTKMQHLQYTEFCCIEDGKIVHTALYVDLVGFMREAGVDPLPNETGHYFVFPGPRDHNGLLFDEQDPAKGEASMKIVQDMITGMYSKDATDPDVMRETWSDKMIWYGSCGVGASYTVSRYQKQHQLPFRNAMTARKSLGRNAFFAEGDFVCFYSDLQLSTKGGWLGMTGSTDDVILRGDLDVYYCKDGKIVENWCMMDLPYWIYQQGVNIFERTTGIANPTI